MSGKILGDVAGDDRVGFVCASCVTADIECPVICDFFDSHCPDAAS